MMRKVKRTRFIILDEVHDQIVMMPSDIPEFSTTVREFTSHKEANEWASERLGNWVVIKQVQWEDDTVPGSWYAIKLC